MGLSVLRKDLYFVFDIESAGLHGPAFAYGFVVVNGQSTVFTEGAAQTEPALAATTHETREWLRKNVDVSELEHVESGFELRQKFWAQWLRWKAKGARMAADVAWPVEARFLTQCIDDAHMEREWDGPYPLIDIASVRIAVGLDPLAAEERLPEELPAHNPLADARQSARLLIEALGPLAWNDG